MEIRWLAADEYGKLDQIPADHAAQLNPDNTLVAVAVEDDRIIGRAVLISLPHLECIWVDSDHRNGTLGARLESFCAEKLAGLGARQMLAVAVNDKIADYLKRLNYSHLGSIWIKEI
jgi:hypothetical protein